MERNDNVFDRDGKNDLHWTAMMHHDGKFYMYYNYGMAVTGPAPFMTGLAVSDDGVNFRNVKDVILYPGTSWDRILIEMHSIIRDGNRWRMYYCGFDGNWRIGMAESDDLLNWWKFPEPILKLGDNRWEDMHVADPHVIFFRGKYMMYYMGKGEVWQVGLATSKDGEEWYKHFENPIIKASEKWCDGCVALSGVVEYKGMLLAAIHGYDKSEEKFRVKLFKSAKGIKWLPADVPAIEPGEWCNRGVVHPEIIIVDNKLHVYYTGIRKGETNEHRIGRVVYDKNILL